MFINTKTIHYILFSLIFTNAFFIQSQNYDPGTGKTIAIIGQTYQQEYEDFNTKTDLTPSGSSHYSTFYLGRIEQGDDNPNSVFLDWVDNRQDDPYALIALSIKDNTSAGNYGQMTNENASNFNSNAVWEALNDIRDGLWDTKIDEFSAILNARPDTKFYLRIGYEVSLLLFAYNGTEYVNTWLNDKANAGINVFENPDNISELDRQAYIDAYNYIANRIRTINNVTNIDFVYHPVRGLNDTKWLYPGDEYVDWVAFSIFNNDICLEVNGTFNCEGEDIDPQLEASIDFAKNRGKQIMVAEAAVQAPASNTVANFKNYLDKLHNVIVDKDIRVLAYINSNWPIHGWGPEWGDSRVETNEEIKQHFKTVFGLNTRYIWANPVLSTSDYNYEQKNTTIYPNPVVSILNISKPLLSAYRIYDITGRLILSGSENQINVSKLTPGTYSLITNNTKKLFIKK